MNAGLPPSPPASLTLLCFALRPEAAAFQKRLAARRAQQTGCDALLEILFTGVGRAQAAGALDAALQTRAPVRVLSCGFAGALNPALAVGDVGVQTGDERLRAALLAAGAQPMRFLTVDQVAITAPEKAALWRASGADAAEMESSALETVCRARGIPFAVVRAISDAAHQELPLDFNRLLGAEGRLLAGRLLGALVRQPARLTGLLRLWGQSQVASERLAEVLVGALCLVG